MSPSGVGQPAGPMPDRCPYHRPFPEGFHDCPTFQRQQFVALTTQEQPLSVHISCVHLRVGEQARNRFYAQCALGTAVDREGWLRQVGERRVAMMRELQVEFAQMYGDVSLEELTAAKAAAIAAPDDAATAENLERLLAELSVAMRNFIESRAAMLEGAGFPVESLQALIDDILERWRVSPRVGTPPVDAEQLEPFAPELRPFLGGSMHEEQARAG